MEILEPVKYPKQTDGIKDGVGAEKSDTSLLAGIRAHDQASLELLYKNYFPRLNRFVTQITQDPHETLDVINEVFLTVWNDASRFRGESSLSSWIIGIAYNKSLATLRKRRKWLSFSDDLDNIAVTESDQALVSDDIYKIMKKLKPEHRAMMELTYYFGYSYKEIADILGLTPSMVRDQLHQARKKIKSLIGDVK